MNYILRIRSIVYLLSFTTLFMVFSCTDKLQEEIDQLKAANAELLLQIDVNTSTIEDLESQKFALESQKGEWQADTALINELIQKVDRILISKHVEKYLTFLVGKEDFSRYSWQHFYNEDLFLVQSEYQVTQGDSFSRPYIMSGETSMPVKSEFVHEYNDDIIVNSESEKLLISWTITDGRIAEMIVNEKKVPNAYTRYLTSNINGNIIESTRLENDAWTNKSLYEYNEQNLLVKLEIMYVTDSKLERRFAYDLTHNLTEYLQYIDDVLHTQATWDYNSSGQLLEYISESPWEKDSIGITYFVNDTWEAYFKRTDKDRNSESVNIRRFDAAGHIIYDFHQKEDEYPFLSEYEYLNGFLSKYTSYYQKRSLETNEWYAYQIKTIREEKNEIGITIDREIEDVLYSEEGTQVSGSLVANKNIVWSINGRNMLKYVEEKYDLFPTTLYEKTDIEKVEFYEINTFYDKKISEYFIEDGEAKYINYSYEILEFYSESPFAPKVKEEKWFDASGTTNAATSSNDNNSTYNWNWVLQN